MDIDAYAHLESPVHTWDPRLKVAAISVFVLVAASCNTTAGLLTAFGAAVIVVVCARLPFRFVLCALRYPLFFVALMLPVLVLTSGGAKLASFGPVPLYAPGFRTGTEMGLRAVTMMMLMLVMFSTSRLHTTLYALQRLRLPHVLVHILLFTYRYIFLYMDDMRTLKNAARLRGYSLGKGLRHIRTSASLIVVLLIRSFEQSERVAAAMRLRGFDGTLRHRGQLHAGATDVVKTACIAVTCIFLIFVECLQP